MDYNLEDIEVHNKPRMNIRNDNWEIIIEESTELNAKLADRPLRDVIDIDRYVEFITVELNTTDYACKMAKVDRLKNRKISGCVHRRKIELLKPYRIYLYANGRNIFQTLQILIVYGIY